MKLNTIHEGRFGFYISLLRNKAKVWPELIIWINLLFVRILGRKWNSNIQKRQSNQYDE